MKTTFAQQFKSENAGKFVYYNGAQGLTDCLLNSQITNTHQEAIQEMANRDSVSYEEVDENYKFWYYILAVEEIEDEYLDDYAAKYKEEIIEDGISIWQSK